jgi:hypothetical protein
MAFRTFVPGGSLQMIADSGVTAITLDSSGNWSSGGIQYGLCVKQNTSGSPLDVVIASTNDHILGIACEDPAAGPSQPVEVQHLGVAKVLAGAALSLGDLVSCDSTGRVVTAAAAGATDKWLVGLALEAATAAGDLISVQLGIFGATNVNA